MEFNETIFYQKWSARITKVRLYIAVAFVKMAIKAIDKNTNEGLSFILTIKNWVDFVNGGMKDIGILELEKEGSKNGANQQ